MAVAPMTTCRPGDVFQLGRKDGRADRVADAHEHHHRDPGEASRRPDRGRRERRRRPHRCPVRGSAAGRCGLRCDECVGRGPKERHAADQQAGERARDVLFGRRHEEPRNAELDDAKGRDPLDVFEKRGELPLAPDEGSRAAPRPGPVRKSTSTPGSSWRTATRISRYGSPQITAMARKRAHPRRDMTKVYRDSQILNFS